MSRPPPPPPRHASRREGTGRGPWSSACRVCGVCCACAVSGFKHQRSDQAGAGALCSIISGFPGLAQTGSRAVVSSLHISALTTQGSGSEADTDSSGLIRREGDPTATADSLGDTLSTPRLRQPRHRRRGRRLCALTRSRRQAAGEVVDRVGDGLQSGGEYSRRHNAFLRAIPDMVAAGATRQIVLGAQGRPRQDCRPQRDARR